MALSATEVTIAAQHQSGRIKCPECSEGRKHHDKTLSITVNPTETLYLCHHCDLSGRIPVEPLRDYTALLRKKITPIPTQLNRDQAPIQQFFKGRGITISDLSSLPPMVTGKKYIDGDEIDCIGFIYGSKENPLAIKWRGLKKKVFTQDGCAAEFYGLRELDPEDKTLTICEGENDQIALASIGIKSISVPNGAPMKASRHRIDPEEDKKFGYVWDARKLIDAAEKIILAVDQDEPGHALAEELARRCNRAKCWRVTFPDGCKDPTDVIREHGKKAMLEVLKAAEPMPLQGVYGAYNYTSELMEFYEKGHGHGESTGYPVLDKLFTIKEGQLSVVTGLPGAGKTAWVSQITVNLALNKHWKFAVASFETPPAMHIAQLAEMIVGKPFYTGPTPRMRREELKEAIDFINEHFVFLESKDGMLPTIDSIINRTKQAVMRLGVRGLIIDPFNYITMPKDENEHSAISTMLTKVTSFCQAYGIHCWFIAHPVKIYPREDGSIPVPKGSHISGSSSWFSKADLGITVHRGVRGVEIHCWKVRFKWIGKQGMALLDYDIPTGRYFESNNKQQSFAPNKVKSSRQRHWQD